MEETIDMLTSIAKEKNIPLDRLICGIVGGDFYVWDYDSGRFRDREFIVIQINGKYV